MALGTPTILYADFGAFSVNPHSSGSFTPTVGRTYIAFVAIQDNAGDPTALNAVTFSGAGLSFTLRATLANVAGGGRVAEVWVGVATGTPTSGTVTATVSGDNGVAHDIWGIGLVVVECTGADTTAPINLSNIGQANGDSTGPTVAMGTFEDASSFTLLFLYCGAHSPTGTVSSPWSELSDITSDGAAGHTVGTMYVAVAEENENPTVTISATGLWEIVGLELVEAAAAGASAAVTGTATAGIDEADVVAGGETIIITLTNDTWVASGATFDGIRQDIIDGLDSAQSEATGWNAEVRDNLATTTVVRTSDTVVTITLSAQAAYDITAQETITVTVPATAVTGGSPITGAPTFTVDTDAVVATAGPLVNSTPLKSLVNGALAR